MHLFKAAAAAYGVALLIIPTNFFLYFETYKTTLFPFLALAYAQVAFGIVGSFLALGYAFGGDRERGFLERLLALCASATGVVLAALGLIGAHAGEAFARNGLGGNWIVR